MIAPLRRPVPCAEARREMEDWTSALKDAGSKENCEVGGSVCPLAVIRIFILFGSIPKLYFCKE